jgi:hypothetical protein
MSICSNGLFNIWSDYENAHLSPPVYWSKTRCKGVQRNSICRGDGDSAKGRLQFARVARYEAILVDGEHSKFDDVLTPVKLLREGNYDASLFVFARYFDLEQRLGLFEAGADDW